MAAGSAVSMWAPRGILAFGLIVCVAVVLFVISAVLTEKNRQNGQHLDIFTYHNQVEPTPITWRDLSLDAENWLVPEQLNFGFSSSPIWFKVRPDSSKLNDDALLVLAYPMLDDVQMFIVDDDGNLITHQKTGDAYAFADRPIAHNHFLFPVNREALQHTILFRIQSEGSVKFPLSLWQTSRFYEFDFLRGLFLAGIVGFVCAIGITSFIMYLFSGSKPFFVHGLFVFSSMTLAITLEGYGYQFLWPTAVFFQSIAVSVLGFLSLTLSLLLTGTTVKTSTYSRNLNKSGYLMFILALVMLVLSMVLPITLSLQLLGLFILTNLIGLIIANIYLFIKGESNAIMLALGYGALLFFIGISSLELLGLNSSLTIDFTYQILIGVSTQSMVLFLAVAGQYKEQQTRVLVEQKKVFEKEREAFKATQNMLTLKEQHEQELQYLVDRRTAELQQTLSDLERVNQELERLSTRDSLTGLKNRRSADTQLSNMLMESIRHNTSLSLVLLDIDRFKSVNDRFGHPTGDECIKHVGKLLSEHFKRRTELTSRFGGEEYLVVIRDLDFDQLHTLCEYFRADVESTPVKHQDVEVNLTVSIGVYHCIPQKDTTAASLISSADKLLYQAKHQGRNQVVCASDSFDRG